MCHRVSSKCHFYSNEHLVIRPSSLMSVRRLQNDPFTLIINFRHTFKQQLVNFQFASTVIQSHALLFTGGEFYKSIVVKWQIKLYYS